MQSNVLANEDTDANATQVEPIQELMDLWQLQQSNALLEFFLELSNPHSHDRHDMSMPVVDMPQQFCELLLVIVVFDGGEFSKILEGLNVPIPDL